MKIEEIDVQASQALKMMIEEHVKWNNLDTTELPAAIRTAQWALELHVRMKKAYEDANRPPEVREVVKKKTTSKKVEKNAPTKG